MNRHTRKKTEAKRLDLATVSPTTLGHLWHRESEVDDRLATLPTRRRRQVLFLVRSDAGKAYLAEASVIQSPRTWKVRFIPIEEPPLFRLVVVPRRA